MSTKEKRKSSISTKIVNETQKLINIQEAYWKGKNPWVTIDNPNPENTKERKIRVKANELYGDPLSRKKKQFIIK